MTTTTTNCLTVANAFRHFKRSFPQQYAQGDEGPMVFYDCEKMTEDGRYQTLPRPWVMTNGCFDLFGLQHAWLLSEALRIAETGSVILALDHDERVAALKGPRRPLVGFCERARATCLIGGVSMVVGFADGDDLPALYDKLRPDHYVRGYPMSSPTLPFSGNFVPLCPITFIPILVDDQGRAYSTTRAIENLNGYFHPET